MFVRWPDYLVRGCLSIFSLLEFDRRKCRTTKIRRTYYQILQTHVLRNNCSVGSCIVCVIHITSSFWIRIHCCVVCVACLSTEQLKVIFALILAITVVIYANQCSQHNNFFWIHLMWPILVLFAYIVNVFE